MNSKSTWNWIIVAAALFAFIFFYQKYFYKAPPGPMKLVPELKVAAVTSVQVYPAGKLEIRADRTNGTWQLSQPVVYPAHAKAIDSLLGVLEHLGPQSYISARELMQRPKFDEEYGFTSPQLSLIIQQGDEHIQILFGDLTAPGDEVFVQVVGAEGVYVVDADLLKLIPLSPDQWRETTLADLNGRAFDRITVTNGTQVIEVQYNPTNSQWALTRPIQARADSGFVGGLVQDLQTFQAMQFVADGPNADLEGFGLQPPALALTLAQNTNDILHLEFGKNSTNIADLVYVRRAEYDSVVTVSNEWLAPWRAPVDDFRDHHLVPFAAPVARIEVKGTNGFVLEHQNGNKWVLAGETIPVDTKMADDLASNLEMMPIMEFKDAVTESDLPTYGLTNPVRQIVIQAGSSPPVQLSFGAVLGDEIYARRSDEGSVYLVKLADYQRVPTAGWQLRERRFWHFTEEDVARLSFTVDGVTRVMIRNGTNSWSLAAGTQGFINDAAIEEVTHRFGEMGATLWTTHGRVDPARYGFGVHEPVLEFDMKDGEKRVIQFGDMAPSQYPYAMVTLDGEEWVFEFPRALYLFAMSYLANTSGSP